MGIATSNNVLIGFISRRMAVFPLSRGSTPFNSRPNVARPLSLHPCVRLSFERVHDKQTDKDSSHGRARQSTRPPHYEEDRASAINVTHRRSLPVETDADRLRPRFDGRPESRPATRRADRSRMPKDFHRADVRCGCGSACLACALEFARSGDTLIVWKLDRLAWSMKQLIETMENLQVRGIGTTVNYHEAG